MAIALSRGKETLAVYFGICDSERPVAGKGGLPSSTSTTLARAKHLEGCTVSSMPSEGTLLNKTIKSIWRKPQGGYARHLLQERTRWMRTHTTCGWWRNCLGHWTQQKRPARRPAAFATLASGTSL